MGPKVTVQVELKIGLLDIIKLWFLPKWLRKPLLDTLLEQHDETLPSIAPDDLVRALKE